MEDILDKIVAVATQTPVIKRIWVFGSRHKGTNGPGSDLDIAVEIEWLKGEKLGFCADSFSLWEAASHKFEDKFRQCSPWELDLQQYAGEESTPNIHRYLTSASRLIYEKDSQGAVTGLRTSPARTDTPP